MGRGASPAASAMQESEERVRVRVEWAQATELRHRIRRIQEAGADVGSLKRELSQIFEQLRHRLAALREMRKERLRLPPASSCSSSSSSSPSVASSVGSTKERGATAEDELQVLNGNLRRFMEWFRDPARKRPRSGEEEAERRSPSSWSFISTPSSPSSSSFSSATSANDFIPLKTKTRRTSNDFVPLKTKTRRTTSEMADSDDEVLFGCPSPASVSSKRSRCLAVWPRECVETWPGVEEEGGGEARVYSGTLLTSWETLPSLSALSPSDSVSSCSSSIHYPLPAFSSSAPSASSSA